MDTDIPTPGTRVLHVRNLPDRTRPEELVAICGPHGRVTNTLILQQSHQGFVEFESPESAGDVLRGLAAGPPPTLRSRTVYFQPSNRQEITGGGSGLVSQGNHGGGMGGSHGMQHGHQQQGHGMHMGGGAGGAGGGGAGAGAGAGPGGMGDPNVVLHCRVTKVLYPITADVLFQLFSPHGKVRRIISFTKNDVFQALIEFETVDSAMKACAALHGQCVYTGCCLMAISFSRLPTLRVKYNNEQSRDFENPNLPTGPSSDYPQGGAGGHGAGAGGHGAGGAGGHHHHHHHNHPGGHGMMGVQGGQGHMGGHMGGQGGPGRMGGMGGGPGGPGGQGAGGVPGGTPVVVVSDLPEDTLPDRLFPLFSIYGNVIRIKVLFNKRDTALVQMMSPVQAQSAAQNLNNCPFEGGAIRVKPSHHSSIKMPVQPGPDGSSDSHLTKDFTNSPLHRYSSAGAVRANRLSRVLFVNHIAEGITDEDLNQLLACEGQFPVNRVKRLEDPHMALVEFENVGHAVGCLVRQDGQASAPNAAPLRVSFSRLGRITA